MPDRGLIKVLGAALFTLAATFATAAQSTDQLFPTPLRTSELTGSIKPRDVGDGRLTTYYYAFEGEQGDLFINVQSKNFTGDIDVFIQSGMLPLTKIVMYADTAENETGRVVYLRKPERLVLRIQGRTPGDDEATYRIKFAGGFAASRLEDTAPAAPKAEVPSDTGIRVNSVGTIVEVIPKPKPSPRVTERLQETTERAIPDVTKSSDAVARDDTRAEVPATTPRNEVLISDPLAKPEVREGEAALGKPPVSRPRRSRSAAAPRPKETAAPPVVSEAERTEPEEKVPAPDPMAGIRLVIYFKNGSVIERPMTEVGRFAVEKAILTVVHKNGTVGRYPMLEVSRVSIE